MIKIIKVIDIWHYIVICPVCKRPTDIYLAGGCQCCIWCGYKIDVKKLKI